MEIIPFVRPDEERQAYIFTNKPVLISREGKPVQYPCIGLFHRDTMEPIAYPCYERWYLDIQESEGLATSTMRKRAIAICSFLNFLLWKTSCDSLHEVTLNTIRGFLMGYKRNENGMPVIRHIGGIWLMMIRRQENTLILSGKRKQLIAHYLEKAAPILEMIKSGQGTTIS